jgi:hypothetical protein
MFFKHTVLLSLSFPWDLAAQFLRQRQASLQENGFSKPPFLIFFISEVIEVSGASESYTPWAGEVKYLR